MNASQCLSYNACSYIYYIFSWKNTFDARQNTIKSQLFSHSILYSLLFGTHSHISLPKEWLDN